MDPNILNEKMKLIQWLSTLEDKTIIDKLIKFRQAETKDWWDSLSEGKRNSIEKGITDAENGNLKPHSAARELYEEWL